MFCIYCGEEIDNKEICSHCGKKLLVNSDAVSDVKHDIPLTTKNNKNISIAIHRLVGKYFCEGYSPNLVIDHIDSNGQNNYYKNLHWVTQKENIHHSYISSGLNQTRNYKIYNIIYPNGYKSHDLIGLTDIIEYIKENNLNCSALSLQKYGYSKDYKLERRDKNAKI